MDVFTSLIGQHIFLLGAGKAQDPEQSLRFVVRLGLVLCPWFSTYNLCINNADCAYSV